MIDLISRSALIEEFRKCHISFNGTPMEESDMMISYRSLARVINRQPPVEAKPVVHGEWIGNTCSACGMNWDENMVNNADDWGYFESMPNFCLNCGADMRGGKND